MPDRRQQVNIEGLRDALSKHNVNVCDQLALAHKRLEELASEETPSRAKEFQARINMGLIRACAQTLKARPELAGKSAGTASNEDLMAAAIADESVGGYRPESSLNGTRSPFLRLAEPKEE